MNDTKRLFDIVASFWGLIVVSPLLLLTALAIRITSKGPILFVQERIGLNGNQFKLYKFRTMIHLAHLGNSTFHAGDTSRVTNIGKVLRKTKIDELPQLFNVLVGELSIVGPRPEVRKWTEVYPHKWKIVHRVRPGITDEASILYRDEEKLLAEQQNPENYYEQVILPKKLELGISYVENHSIKGDFIIIFRTILAIITK